MQIQYTDRITIKDGIKCLVFGPAGIGKTPLLATAPEMCILSAEKGLLSLRKTHTAYLEVNDIKSLYEAVDWLLRANESRRFYSYGLDSLSEIAEVVFADKKTKNKDIRAAYRETQDDMFALVRRFRDIPQKNVVFIAKQYEMTLGMQPNTYRRAFPVMPSEKLVNGIPYYFDLVMHMYAWNEQYRALHTKESPYYFARDRSGMLAEVEQPNLAYIFHKVTS